MTRLLYADNTVVLSSIKINQEETAKVQTFDQKMSC